MLTDSAVAVITEEDFIVPCPHCGAPTGLSFTRLRGKTYLTCGKLAVKSCTCLVCFGQIEFAPSTRSVNDLIDSNRRRFAQIADKIEQAHEDIRKMAEERRKE